jgi:hypothetical protein
MGLAHKTGIGDATGDEVDSSEIEKGRKDEMALF